jgi:hypothetical protein
MQQADLRRVPPAVAVTAMRLQATVARLTAKNPNNVFGSEPGDIGNI